MVSMIVSTFQANNHSHHTTVYLDMGAVGTSPSTNAYIEFKLDSTNWASYARFVDESLDLPYRVYISCMQEMECDGQSD